MCDYSASLSSPNSLAFTFLSASTGKVTPCPFHSSPRLLQQYFICHRGACLPRNSWLFLAYWFEITSTHWCCTCYRYPHRYSCWHIKWITLHCSHERNKVLSWLVQWKERLTLALKMKWSPASGKQVSVHLNEVNWHWVNLYAIKRRNECHIGHITSWNEANEWRI